MGRCTVIGGKPSPVSIQLPGGIKVASMTSGTQQVPNSMDPFQSLINGAQPALGAIQPAFDVIGFVMKILDMQILVFKVIGSLMQMFAPGNPFSLLFKLDPMLDENDEPVLVVPKIEVGGVVVFEGGPEIPDFPGLAPKLIDSVIGLFGSALKLAGLIPQFSMAVSIKDTVITAMSFADAAMSQTNSLTDLFTNLPAADTGNSTFDDILQCAADNSQTQLEHKLGPLSNLVPLMSVVSLLADAAAQPLPRVIYDMGKIMANPQSEGGLGVIPFPDLSGAGGPTAEEQRENFLGFIDELTITGLPIEIPDFNDLSNIGTLLNDLREKVEPLLPVIELVQSIFDKLTES